MNKTLVLGATGTVGRALLDELKSLNLPVRAASRNHRRAAVSIDPALEWIEFDLERPATFAPALAGVERVFLISRPGDEAADRYAEPFIRAMQNSDVRHVVDLSALGAERRPDFSTRKVELLIEAAGLPFTHLRPNFFMQIHSVGPIQVSIRDAGRIALPAADARLSFIDARDVAAVAARILAEPRPHVGQAYDLTGPAALDYREVAAAITQAVGRPVQYLPLEDDAMRAALQSAGLPAPRIDRLLDMYRLVRQNACSPISPCAATILARPPIAFQQFAADHAENWR